MRWSAQMTGEIPNNAKELRKTLEQEGENGV